LWTGAEFRGLLRNKTMVVKRPPERLLPLEPYETARGKVEKTRQECANSGRRQGIIALVGRRRFRKRGRGRGPEGLDLSRRREVATSCLGRGRSGRLSLDIHSVRILRRLPLRSRRAGRDWRRRCRWFDSGPALRGRWGYCCSIQVRSTLQDAKYFAAYSVRCRLGCSQDLVATGEHCLLRRKNCSLALDIPCSRPDWTWFPVDSRWNRVDSRCCPVDSRLAAKRSGRLC
jgi:hypothetical protein